jgi:RNA polymerase sigma factor (sigma-70 family)
MTSIGTTAMVQTWLDALPQADSDSGRQARAKLIEHSRRRMEALCRKMFFPSLKGKPVGWDDVYQEAAIRLWKALEDEHPQTVREFFGLGALQIRRVLLDMCRKFGKSPPPLPDPSDAGSSLDPFTLTLWTAFHEAVERLEPKQREAFCLCWYQDLTQAEAAEILGIDKSTVKRHCRAARLQILKYVPGAPDESMPAAE